jgi:hypothetical protein
MLAQVLLYCDRQTGLFLDLALKSHFKGLAVLDAATGQYPKAAETCWMIAIYFLSNEDAVAVDDQTQDDIHVFHVTPAKDDEACATIIRVSRAQ